jgi:xanthosine utilization system XapX-like protein
MKVQRSLRGAVAGSVAAAVWAAQQPLDKRLFESDYDDVELLGKLVTRGREWPIAGLVLHVGNGALFGAVYSQLRPFVPAPPVAAGLVAGLAEHVALWPLVRLVDEFHPAKRDLPKLSRNRRAFAQAAWRHALFGAVLGGLEALINDRSADEPPPIPYSSNGHGSLEATVSVAEA